MTKELPTGGPRVSHTTYFTMYERATERITREVSCSTDNVCPPPLRPGEFRLVGRGNGITQKVVGGKVVDKSVEEMALLKERNPRLKFDDGS